MNIITVSELNEKIKNLLESTFSDLLVEGEISRPTYHTSGHLYFSLKDENSVIRCVMFRSYVAKHKFRIEEGQKVVISGKLSLYKPRGEYQINCFKIEPAGAGALAVAYEQLKKKLEAKGYFEKIYKKEIPRFVTSVAIVTSKTGAALQDMLRVINSRWPLLRVYLINTLVQGTGAAEDIANSIKIADSLGVDVIVVGRGGGSLEDLWAFNEEVVADAIFLAKTPVVSAVGHEIDFLISDFVADMRAPTPSAAMEMILPDRFEMMMYLDNLRIEYKRGLQKFFLHKQEILKHLLHSFEQSSPSRRLGFYQEEIRKLKEQTVKSFKFFLNRKSLEIPELKKSILQTANHSLHQKSSLIEHLKERLETVMETKKTKKGFAQVVKDKKPVDVSQLEIGDIFELQSLEAKIKGKVLEKEEFAKEQTL
ncbi:exodeoxyribonuclease VII large subunit [Nitrosophilus alvini]|uniref:exodeoxyribonuclease VII large subunit n=1 Tax=Nitrosophilus alvini TaxID=2714855 RepID=UPI00190DC21B|nr:exodeoxyribonuclease VII large subunit [Nitrosophilus alvini]